MKVVLRQVGTEKYLNNKDEWVEGIESARVFESMMEASMHWRRNPVKKAEIVGRFNGRQYDVIMACPEE